MSRDVTEQDLRAPQFKGMKVEDLEFRENGDIVRKDRWETTVRRIACQIVGSRSKFECDEIVDAVDKLVGHSWTSLPPEDLEDLPEADKSIEIKMADGSVLRDAWYNKGIWTWDMRTMKAEKVVAWRDQL